MIAVLARHAGYIANSVHCALSDGFPVVFYNQEANFGDGLNKALLSRITGKSIFRVSPFVSKHVLGIGSVLASANHRSYVWGSGFLSEEQQLLIRPRRLCALRGRLSARKCAADSATVLGDPALLLPRYFDAATRRLWRIGLVPHISELGLFNRTVLMENGIALIDLRVDTELVIRQITECEVVVSSSLHGVIVGHAYGIPTAWIRISERPLGGIFKFRDFFSALDSEPDAIHCEPTDLAQLRMAAKKAHAAPCNHLLAPLLSAFPHELAD